MPFGITGRTGPGMRQVVGFEDRSTGRSTFGGEFIGRAIVTNGDLFSQTYFGQTFLSFVMKHCDWCYSERGAA